jgi:hypothetical protein
MNGFLISFTAGHGASSLSLAVVGGNGFIVFWALLVFVFVLFG